MSRHFSYLLEDESRRFFQKVAEEQVPPPPRTIAFTKTAGAATPLEKLAARVMGDLAILKAAGPVGITFGMSKRACNYLERMASDHDLLANEECASDLFNKVAATALDVDVDEATQQLCAAAPAEMAPYIQSEMAKIGLELAKQAAGGLGFFERAGKGLGRLIGGAGEATGAIRQVGAGAKRMITKPFAEAAHGYRAGALEGATKRVANLEREIGATRAARETAGTAAGRGFHEGALSSLEKQRAAAQANVALRKNVSGVHGFKPVEPHSSPKPAPPATSAAKPVSPASKPASSTTTATKPKMSLERQRAEAEMAKLQGKSTTAPAAAAPKSSSSVSSAKNEEGAEKAREAATTPSSPESGEGKPGVMNSLKKFRDQGWGALSGEEKTHVLGAGAAGLAGLRTLEGRDALTGDKS